MSTVLKDKASIPEVIKEMTLEEKALLLTGASPLSTYGIKRLGIPSALFIDGGTGINFMQLHFELLHRYEKEMENGQDIYPMNTGLEPFNALIRFFPYLSDPDKLPDKDRRILDKTEKEIEKRKPNGKSPGCFPPGILMGATWDPETVYLCGSALGKEANAYQIDVLLGTPNVNIHRDPLNGRLFEGYSEDPCLVSKLAPSFVKGVQEEGVIANAKHFAANNQETERVGVNEHIPVRALHEIYFPGFKACVKEGRVKTIMSAYNKINGKACSANKWLLTEVLRGKWGFEGFVMSDWGAVSDQVEAYRAGNDLVMPGPRNVKNIIEAVNTGILNENVLDNCIADFLGIMLEMPVMKGRRYIDIDSEYSKKAAYRAAAEGCVLLKNDNGLLPLNKNMRISFFGERSRKFVESGSGSAEVWTDLSSNIFDSTIEKIGEKAVAFGAIENNTDAVVITVGAAGQEGSDRSGMDIDQDDRVMLENILNEAKDEGKMTIVILNVSGPVHMTDWLDKADAVLCVFIPGMEGGHAAADILFGDLNPSGKLPLTFPKFYRDCPTYGNFPGESGEVWYGEGIFVGYRYYDFKEIEPLFPFGFGLSYTTFEMSDISISSTTMNMDNDDKLQVKVKVKNTGKVAGKEVVQLYITHEKSTLLKPPKELKTFKKIYLKPGEEKDVLLELNKEDIAGYDPAMDQWVCEPGYYKVLVGNSSRNILLSIRFKATGENPYGFGPNIGVGKIFSDNRAIEVLKKYLEDIPEPSEAAMNEIRFLPQTRFADVWDDSFVPLLINKTIDERNIILANIYKEFKNIDMTEK
ncbi:MAG: glycoside hydrolase family 3 C-terminal domain-containing protein [Bacillota bacterium]|nr:glycoside hydrolase family 3 C-terminal domain-containing protein [Bacillota bacterium]